MKFLALFITFLLVMNIVSSCNFYPDEVAEDTGETIQAKENILLEKEIFKGKEYLIEEGSIELYLGKNCLISDDEIKITSYENKIEGNENIVFNNEAYEIELEENVFFNEPVTLTLIYDEEIIPEGVSENSIFVAFETLQGDIFYQGGEIDTADGGKIEISQNSPAEETGTQVAHSIYKGLNR